MSQPTRHLEARERELAREQAYVTRLYDRLDALRDHTRRQLDAVLAQGGGGTLQNRSERDTFAGMYAERLARLWAVEHALCFGRIDHAEPASGDEGPGDEGPGGTLYIGRIGLSDDERRLLIDWRAPVAQPFYRATPAAPMGITRRRHLQTRARRVTGIDDDLLDLDNLADADRATLNGEAALLASITAARTGRMRDIVATIQAEQDRVIRSALDGVLVVQGGPGTGKTVVALHRAAYLLYTHRERLARRGVLILGPNPTFLRYIEQVLPSLGETDVLLSTVGELFPGVRATARDRDAVAAVKGDPRMAKVIARAVTARQRVPRGAITIDMGGHALTLEPRVLEAARNRAARSRRPHNQARAVFVRHLLNSLARQSAKRLGKGLIDDEELADLREELRTEPPVRAALNRLWPYLTPQRLLIGLYTSPERLGEAAGDVLTSAERRLLSRPAPGPQSAWEWTEADVPLLDEAAELLGDIDEQVLRASAWMAEEERAAAAAAAREDHDRELAYAREVLALTGMSDMMDAERLAARHRDDDDGLTTAERAAADRTWAFGYVIVDEAQELSPMAWRAVMRRCPARAMTVVGDIAQSGTSAGPASWGEVLAPYTQGRHREETLTVNYRTPAELMALAANVLGLIGPGLPAPRSVREGGEPPWALAAGSIGAVGSAAAREAAAGGRLAVLTPAGLAEEVGAAVTASVPGAVAGPGAAALDAPAAVLTVADAKGLEFDSVIVVEPSRILAESPRGASDLYVALTRATQRLGLVHSGPLPPVLPALPEPPSFG
ncbi:ATP-binding domain-containing protein [Spongiactinospora sp. TRM90649]|uniref:HelD family protein n=1 Tax=Spongiactinospora sp. TRM90649 TaxID=3031114 RepID=UPI0023F6E17A|nr:ATP-binding domain-containing protein [Spongiactinospora sp. TRM90649]MDF5756730.1 AAA family ATPase [Spongiactinospora sp. TRM90649]